MNFMIFSASIFALICSSIFNGKWSPNGIQKLTARPPFFHLFRDPVFYVDFMLILVTILVHLAHFWRPFGSLRLPLGSLLVPVGSLLVPLGSLLLTLAIDFLIFGASWPHFSYLHVISIKILCKIIFFENCH